MLQPDVVAPLGRLEEWLHETGVSTRVIDLATEPVPAIDALGDGLIVLGGHMNAVDESATAWLVSVKALVVAAQALDIPILGICLGHQILAEALGGTVTVSHPNGREAGATALHWRPEALQDPVLGPLASLGDCVVPESHHDAVTELPPGSVWLASTDAYPHQAFRVGSALGVQFHPETTPDMMAQWHEMAGHDPEPMRQHMMAVEEDVKRQGRLLAQAFAAQVRDR